jgi:hypothetical protein
MLAVGDLEEDAWAGGLAVARVMTKAALLEQTVMSGSTATIFFTRVTVIV